MADGMTWEMERTMPRGLFASPGLKERVQAYERQLILDALRMAAGNQRRAAASLGCLPTTLNEKMRRLGLRACDASSSEPPSPEPANEHAY